MVWVCIWVMCDVFMWLGNLVIRFILFGVVVIMFILMGGGLGLFVLVVCLLVLL